jgi:hypothetical protein
MKGENLVGHVMLSNAQNWGRTFTASSGTSANAAVDSVDNISQENGKNNVNMLESYIWWKTNDMFSLKMGRGMFTLADGAVVSANDYEQIPKTFDGVLGAFDFGFMGLNVFGVKGAELGSGNPSAGTAALAYDREQNFYGFSADFKNLPDMIKMANVHLIKEVQDNNTATADATTATAGKDWLRFGLTVGGDWMNVDYKVTYANLSGKRRGLSAAANATNEVTTNASMLDLGAGYTFSDMMKLRIGAVYHMDSGDNDDETKTNNTYDGFHYDKHMYLPETGAISALGNLTYFGAKVTLEPMENTTVGLSYTDYSRSSEKAEVSNAVSHTAGTHKEKGLGNEVNILAGHKYSDAFNIGFRYSMWNYGEYFKKANAVEVKRAGTNQWLVSATLKF